VSSAGLLAALEQCWAAIRVRHVEIPHAMIVVASGSPDRAGQAMKLGHFASHRWQHGDQRISEVLVSGEGLSRTAPEVLTTLLHEAAHALADVRDIKETSRQGRYHNEKFAKLARELGLEPSKDSKIGWSPCTLPDTTAGLYTDSLTGLEAVLRVYRHAENHSTKDRNSNNGVSCECGCGRKIRLSRSVFEQGPVICGVCDEPFTADDSGGAR
jgi:hypothetical protein